MALQRAKNAIAKKRREHRFLGKVKSNVKDLEYGGYMREFENGNIYYHPSTGAHEVHGGILKKYIARGAYGKSTSTKRRELGFPMSDELRTREGYPYNKFEWGEIVFFPGTNGGVSLSGAIYRSYKSSKKRMSDVGYPVLSNFKSGLNASTLPTSNLSITLGGKVNTTSASRTSPGIGEICIFERAICVYNRRLSLSPFWIDLIFPLIGNPTIVSRAKKKLRIFLHVTNNPRNNRFLNSGGFKWLQSILDDRFKLKSVGKNDLVDLKLENARKGPGYIEASFQISSKQVSLNLETKGQLYDLLVRSDEGHDYRLSPHCMYQRNKWNNFGLLHATDIHIARRNDEFRSKLKQSQKKYPKYKNRIQKGIDNLNNWNNGFRDFIRYANAMYKKGIVDGIMATGDIVDYLYEVDDNRKRGGNFEYFRNIVLGKSDYPEKEHKAEELLVPIFTSLGNHDYRLVPYHLDAHLGAYKGIVSERIKNFEAFNLTNKEARIVQGGNPRIIDMDMYRIIQLLKSGNAKWRETGIERITGSQAKKQVLPAAIEDFYFYRNSFNRDLSKNVIVNLDKHNLVLLDTGPDRGGPNNDWDDWDAFKTSFLGIGSSNENAFYNYHAPNSIGPNNDGIHMVNSANSSNGITIIGMHAPPINIWKDEYAHYLRETEHNAVEDKNLKGFVLNAFYNMSVLRSVPRYKSSAMYRVNKGLKDWPYDGDAFKVGKSYGRRLDYGVSRGPKGKDMDYFLRLISGRYKRTKPIDLLLCGHDHQMAEMRAKWNSSESRMEFFTDYYTENPKIYYSTDHFDEDLNKIAKVQVKISNRSKVNAPLRRPAPPNDDYLSINVPPYDEPLNDYDDKAKWWEEHKPLIIQGAPLGPTDSNNRERKKGNPPQPSFEGCKLVIIRNDIIDKIIQVSRKELSKSRYHKPTGVDGVGIFSNSPTRPKLKTRIKKIKL